MSNFAVLSAADVTPFAESIGPKLRRLASQAAAFNPYTALVASGVTMTTTATLNAALTKSVVPSVSPGSFSPKGGTAQIYNVNFWAFPVSDISPSTSGNMASYFPATPGLQAIGWEVEFYSDAPVLMVRMFGYTGSNSNFRIIVDGQYVTKAATTYAQTGLSYVQLDFAGVRQPRRIQFRSMQGNAFGGVFIDNISTVWAPTDQNDVLKVAFTGDSYSDRIGIVGSTVLPDNMWCHVVGHLLGWRDIRQVAVGGTGYINDSGTRSKIQNQIPRWISINPDVVVVAAGYNDPISDPAALTAAALLAYRTIRSGAPKAPIFIFGPWAGTFGPSATNLQKEAAILAAFQQFADPNSYFIAQNNTTSPWLTAGGYVSAANTSGNSGIYISNDSIHPSEDGHPYLGFRAATELRAIIQKIAA